MPIYSPTGFLDITNATLRTSNVEAENLLMTGGNIYVTSELETNLVLNLENVTNKGNITSNTIQFTNTKTSLIASSNVDVVGNVFAYKFIGSGAGLTNIPPSAITGTLSQWSDGTNGDVFVASNVGIGNVHTLTSNTLQVGGNLYVRDTDANVLTVNGNVVASYFEGDGSKLSGIVTDLQGVTDNGNVTTNVVQFSNATTGLVTTANVEVGGDVKIAGLTAGTVPYVGSDKFLKDSFITTTGDATVITSNLDVTGNIFMRGEKYIVNSETKLINDAIIGIANNNTVSTTDKGIIMQNTAGNVAIIHHGTGDAFAGQLTFGYTDDPLDTITVTNDLTKELTVNVLGNVITQNNLSVGGTLSINNITAAAQHSLQAVTNVGNTTSNTVQFTNTFTSLTASSNIVATGNVSAGYDTDTTSHFGRAAVGYMGTSDHASFAHVDHNTTSDYAIKQTASGPTYINTTASGHIRFTVADGLSNAEKMRITNAGNVGIGASSPGYKLDVYGTANVGVLTATTVTTSGGATFNTNTLKVDAVNSRIGVGTTSPMTKLDIAYNAAAPAIVFSDTTNSRYQTGIGSFHVTNEGQRLDFYTGDSSTNGTLLTNTPRMCILGNGNVGVGTTGPSYPLDVQYTGDSGIRSKNIGTSHASVYIDSASGYSYLRFESSGAAKFWIQSTPTGDLAFRPSGGGHVVDIKNDGKVGIGRTDPDYPLDVFGRIGFCNTVSGKTHQHWHLSGGTDANTGNFYTVYKASGYNATWRTRVQGSAGNQATLNFTGQHKTYIKDISSERAEELEGLIVSANTNKYMKMSEGVEVGQNAITINESLPIVNISNVSQDKTCFGVISGSEDPENVRGETIGCFTAFIHKEDGDTRVHINSVGEGALWVVNTNGPIESGDYITSSNIAGYGMKQESECLMNYTVAKSTMDCDFNPLTQKKRRIVKEERDAVAWVLRKYEEVSEEEYNNTPEDKRKIEDDTFKIEREYVSRHDLDNEDYIKETRTFEFSVLDENKQLVWEDTDETELEYKIRYLDANGNITTEENATHKAAFIGCTYHCG